MKCFSHKNIDNILLFISFFVIIILSFWIFMLNYGKNAMELQIQSLKDENKNMLEKIKDYNNMQYGIEGQKITFQSLKNTEELKAFLKEKSRYIIAILFTHLDCGSYVNRELLLWQRFYNKILNRKKIIIIAITQTPNPKSTKFLVRGIFQYPLLFDSNDQNESLFSRLDVPRGFPIVLFIDKENQKIVYAHIGDDKNGEGSQVFLQKIKNFLEMSLNDMNVD